MTEPSTEPINPKDAMKPEPVPHGGQQTPDNPFDEHFSADSLFALLFLNLRRKPHPDKCKTMTSN